MIDLLLYDTVVGFRHITCNAGVIQSSRRIKHATARTLELLTDICLKGKQKYGRGDDEDMHIFPN